MSSWADGIAINWCELQEQVFGGKIRSLVLALLCLRHCETSLWRGRSGCLDHGVRVQAEVPLGA